MNSEVDGGNHTVGRGTRRTYYSRTPDVISYIFAERCTRHSGGQGLLQRRVVSDEHREGGTKRRDHSCRMGDARLGRYQAAAHGRHGAQSRECARSTCVRLRPPFGRARKRLVCRLTSTPLTDGFRVDAAHSRKNGDQW